MGRHVRHQCLDNERIEPAPQHGLTAEAEVCLSTQPVEDTGHLDSNVTRAKYHGLLWLGFEVEETVRGDPMLSALQPFQF